MSVAAELGEPGQVVEQARGFRPTALRHAGRHYYYWRDLGRAFTYNRSGHDAEASLLRAEHADPTRFVVDPTARDAVETLVDRAQRRRRQSIPEGLRTLTRRLKIDIA
jgi:hypothetical protein